MGTFLIVISNLVPVVMCLLGKWDERAIALLIICDFLIASFAALGRMYLAKDRDLHKEKGLLDRLVYIMFKFTFVLILLMFLFEVIIYLLIYGLGNCIVLNSLSNPQHANLNFEPDDIYAVRYGILAFVVSYLYGIIRDFQDIRSRDFYRSKSDDGTILIGSRMLLMAIMLVVFGWLVQLYVMVVQRIQTWWPAMSGILNYAGILKPIYVFMLAKTLTDIAFDNTMQDRGSRASKKAAAAKA